MQPSSLLSIDEAAPLLGISTCSLRLLIHAGKIRHMRIGPNAGRYRFKREWLEDYLQSCVCDPVEPLSPELRAKPPEHKANHRSKSTAMPVVQSQKDRLREFKLKLKGG